MSHRGALRSIHVRLVRGLSAQARPAVAAVIPVMLLDVARALAAHDGNGIPLFCGSCDSPRRLTRRHAKKHTTALKKLPTQSRIAYSPSR